MPHLTEIDDVSETVYRIRSHILIRTCAGNSFQYISGDQLETNWRNHIENSFRAYDLRSSPGRAEEIVPSYISRERLETN